MKVAVYAIALNEQAFVERFMATASEADLVVVADTGSTDQTAAALVEAGAIVHTISIRPWRFMTLATPCSRSFPTTSTCALPSISTRC